MAPPGLFGSFSRQPTQARPSPSLVHRHDSFAPTFTSRRRPPCRIHHLRNTSRKPRHTPRCGQSLITQRERTSLGSSISPLMSALTNTPSQIQFQVKVGLNHTKTLRKRLGPSRQRQTARHSRDAKSSRKRKAEMRKASSKAETQLKVSNAAETSRTPPEPQNSPLKAEIKAECSKQAENQIFNPQRQKSANSP
jgi:hypothetical protein